MKRYPEQLAFIEAIASVADYIYREIESEEDRISSYREQELESSEIWRIQTIIQIEARVKALNKVAEAILKFR